MTSIPCKLADVCECINQFGVNYQIDGPGVTLVEDITILLKKSLPFSIVFASDVVKSSLVGVPLYRQILCSSSSTSKRQDFSRLIITLYVLKDSDIIALLTIDETSDGKNEKGDKDDNQNKRVIDLTLDDSDDDDDNRSVLNSRSINDDNAVDDATGRGKRRKVSNEAQEYVYFNKKENKKPLEQSVSRNDSSSPSPLHSRLKSHFETSRIVKTVENDRRHYFPPNPAVQLNVKTKEQLLAKLKRKGYVKFGLSSLLTTQLVTAIFNDYREIVASSQKYKQKSWVRQIYDARKCKNVQSFAKKAIDYLFLLLSPLLENPCIGNAEGTIQFVTAPALGDAHQKWHRDTDEDAYVVLVPLVTVTKANGCTELIRDSRHLDPQYNVVSNNYIHKNVRMNVGEMTIFDARLLHRGTANCSETERPMLIITITPNGQEFHQELPTMTQH